MVAGAFPLFKLAILGVKQMSKPLANVIVTQAKNHKVFREQICMRPAQLYNWMEVKYKMWIMNLGKPVHIPKLTEPMAIELGANLLGEFIIFSIGAGLLMFEYVRSSNKDARKEEAIKQEKLELALTLSELAFRLEKQDTQIREITRTLAELDSRSIFHFKKETNLKLKQTVPPETEALSNSSKEFIARELSQAKKG